MQPKHRLFKYLSSAPTVRRSLRPGSDSWGRRAGGNPEALLAAFTRTANEYRGSTVTLERYWSWAEELAADGELPVPVAELQTFFAELRSTDFPAVHHSETYETAYHPAYRVFVHDYLLPPQAR